MFSIISVPKHMRSMDLLCKLQILWENSVRATHHFLSDDDVVAIKPYVKEAIAHIDILLMVCQENEPVAFMGLQDKKIEMLFVSSEHFRKGIGQSLISCAIERYQIAYVDVNEQNPGAKAFYEAMGFAVYERSETDEQGNNFPILRMKLV